VVEIPASRNLGGDDMVRTHLADRPRGGAVGTGTL